MRFVFNLVDCNHSFLDLFIDFLIDDWLINTYFVMLILSMKDLWTDSEIFLYKMFSHKMLSCFIVISTNKCMQLNFD